MNYIISAIAAELQELLVQSGIRCIIANTPEINNRIVIYLADAKPYHLHAMIAFDRSHARLITTVPCSKRSKNAWKQRGFHQYDLSDPTSLDEMFETIENHFKSAHSKIN